MSVCRLGCELPWNSHQVGAFEKEVGGVASVTESRHRQAAGENKEPAANLIIISHLFTDLMCSLRCQDAPFLLRHSAPSLALIPLFFSLRRPRLSPRHLPGIGPSLKGGLWWNPFRAKCGGLKCHFSIDYLPHKAAISLATLNFISSLFAFKSARTIAQSKARAASRYSSHLVITKEIIQRVRWRTVLFKWMWQFLSFWHLKKKVYIYKLPFISRGNRNSCLTWVSVLQVEQLSLNNITVAVDVAPRWKKWLDLALRNPTCFRTFCSRKKR